MKLSLASDSFDHKWLRKIGFEELYSDSPIIYATKDIGYDCHCFAIGYDPKDGAWYIHNTWENKSVNIPSLITKGQVVDLCKVFEIKIESDLATGIKAALGECGKWQLTDEELKQLMSE